MDCEKPLRCSVATMRASRSISAKWSKPALLRPIASPPAPAKISTQVSPGPAPAATDDGASAGGPTDDAPKAWRVVGDERELSVSAAPSGSGSRGSREASARSSAGCSSRPVAPTYPRNDVCKAGEEK